MAEKDGLSDMEVEELRKEYNQIVEDMLSKRDQIMEDFGWETDSNNSSQSGRTGGITSITEETAGRLEGIANAQLDHIISIDGYMESIGGNLSIMVGSMAKIAENSEYLKKLEDIADSILSMSNTGIKIKN